MCGNIVTILLRKLGILMLIEGIHDSRSKLSGWDSLREQDIKFVIGPVPGLWKTKVTPHEHPEAGSSPHESSVAFEVPSLRIHEVLLESAGDNTRDV